MRETVAYLLAYDVDTGILRRDANGNIIGSIVYGGVGHRNAFAQSPASSAAALRRRSVARIDLAYCNHALALTWCFTSGVYDDQGVSLKPTGTDAVRPVVATKIRAFSVFDAQYGLAFGNDDQFDITLGVINIFDKYSGIARQTGYVPSVADPFGRQIYARVGMKF